ncbi:ATP-binding response regulator [Roseofilum casamattae]|uniref:histidine kinase n=1 Tax=Roseofilum casamattae BLCC-M143 TaxID=3022442 RepID=A0ABT7BTG4_9CYAN|nr:AAA family ATPase [Roseofilum casamattae]MDJ1182475.1 AAA family ATPase [Roseofilum casamattae BLCC-M143]
MNTPSISLPNYQIADPIYSGSRTLVYRAIRIPDERAVIIKILRNPHPHFNELLGFRNQYAIATNLDSPYIVRPLALERYGSGYALVMPDEGAISLSEYWQASVSDLTTFLEISIQLADVLHYLTQQRIIHKDIKPANILIHPETGQVQLIDFSIASLLPKEQQQLVNPNVLEGTLAYISPEQTGRMNRGIDYRTDFYSLGVTLYELLTGLLPFSSDDLMELIHSHIAQKVQFPSDRKIPHVLQTILLRLMAKNAEERYQSALGLKHDLEQCLRSLQDMGEIAEFELGERDICDRFIIPEKLYGRETELQTLLEAFEDVANGTSKMMLVAGFSGIGKTAVINEVHKPIVEKRGYFIKGKFDQFNRNIPFSAFVQAFRDLMGQLLSELDEELANWKSKILAALGENGQVLIDVIPELERVIGQQPPATELSGTAAQNRFNLLFQKFIAVFTTPEHPLVMFLDDLQWADSASLNLMKVLMGESQTGYLLLLGAYRDNEVFPAHPLMLTLSDLEKQEAAISTITLAPLPVSDINQLIAETLSCSSRLAQPLTELVYQKTKGNPFFTTQFLKGLYEDELLVFNFSLGYWECDLVKVRDAALTDDVVEFMARRLQKLPQVAQKVMKLAACIGNQFDLETLAIVCESSVKEAATDLWVALQEGLILPRTEAYKFFQAGDRDESYSDEIAVSYRFLHDLVQQAAYSLIADDRKQPVHLKIGQLLLAHQSNGEQEDNDNIFSILNHLMMGIDADPSSIPVTQLAELALSAGMKAKLSIAYQAAIEYFNFGRSRLPEDAWNTHYRLMLDLNREKAECDYLVGRFEESESILNEALTKAQSPLDSAQIYVILMNQSITQGTNISAGVDAGIKGLAILGLKLSTDTATLEPLVEEELQQVRDTFDRVPPRILLELPEMSDPVQQSLMELLSTLWTISFVSGNQFLGWFLTLRMINLSIKYGRAPSSSLTYSFYAVALANEEHYQEAYEFCRVALDFDRTFHNTQFIGKNNNAFANHIAPYVRPLAENLILYSHSIQVCAEVGDLIYGVWAAFLLIWTHLLIGTPLPFVEEEIQKYIDYVRNVNDQNILNIFERQHQLVRELMDNTVEDGTLTLKGFVDSPFLENWRKIKFDHGINWYGFLVLKRLYLKGNYEQALQVAQLLQTTLPGNSGLFPIITYHVYYPLSLSAVYSAADGATQTIYLQQIQEQQQILQKFSENCSYNFLHKYQLISAEIARLNGDRMQAMELYDRAIAGAKENEYIQEEALANELAAKFYLDWGKEKIAATYMQEAYYCYTRWGAKVKTDHLEANYPQLLLPILQQQQVEFNPIDSLANLTQILTSTLQSQTQSSTNISEALDFGSIVQAAQKLSNTIELEKLLADITQIILTNAGAEKIALLVPDEQQWQIQARAELASDGTVVTQTSAESLTPESPVPIRLIQYVKNTQKPVLIDEGKTDISGILEGYLLEQQPQSVFCIPLLNQGELVAIIYLEHATTKGVFTTNRQTIIEFLCAQAAVALQNAKLYSQAQKSQWQAEQALSELQQAQLLLEQKVIERTAELAVAKEKAEDANKAKSQFIANMSHELRSPLNAILGFAQIMTRSQTLPSEHQENVGIINRSGEHLLTLINNVLDLSKIEAGRITLNEKNFDLHRLLDDLHDMFQLKASDKGLQLLLESEEHLPRYIRTDEVKLRQILINLINNALKFTKQGGISVKVTHQLEKQQPTTIHFAVEDTGAGIAPEELDQLFEAFTQTASGKQAQEGTGLGLSISRKFVQLMGGDIQATSRVGEGTVFSFEIQCLEVESTDVEALSTQRRIIALEPGQPRYRLLIVDDKPVNRQLLIHLLGPLGFELQEASNGKEAVEVWEKWEPHLIWMDMRMPVMDGFEATKTIKATTKGQATAIVALTASVLEEERAVVLSAGCNDFLRKPFRDEEIFQALEKHLEVRYIYEESGPSSKNEAPQKEVLTAENVQALSPELQKQLRQAVISSSQKQIAVVVAAIAETNLTLSEAIASRLYNFEYDKILQLIPNE